MINIEFTTARGALVQIKSLGAHEGVLHINGEARHGGISLAIDTTHGLCIKTMLGGNIIPVPVAAQESVSAYFARRAADIKAAAQADAEADARRARVLRAMQGG